MDVTSRRYSSPSRPPRLVVRMPASASLSSIDPPVLCLHCAGVLSRPRYGLVSFDWGRVEPAGSRR